MWFMVYMNHDALLVYMNHEVIIIRIVIVVYTNHDKPMVYMNHPPHNPSHDKWCSPYFQLFNHHQTAPPIQTYKSCIQNLSNPQLGN
jgi:hypothetical protein